MFMDALEVIELTGCCYFSALDHFDFFFIEDGCIWGADGDGLGLECVFVLSAVA